MADSVGGWRLTGSKEERKALSATGSLHAVCHGGAAVRPGDAIKERSRSRRAVAVGPLFFEGTPERGKTPFSQWDARTGVRRRDAINASDQRPAAHRTWAPSLAAGHPVMA
ncbi:hypothetical protein [Methylibium petroleiphilum]|uniref:hypothetical protein n=1 Tax=Methylibium petroleiphilum TaxID=105560 RepID=UPI003D28DE0F